MDKTKQLVCAVLVLLMIVGAFSVAFGDDGPGEAEYQQAVAQAEDYTKRELYELAIRSYEQALSIRDTEELRGTMLEIWAAWYAEDPSVLKEYTAAAQSAVSAYGSNVRFRQILAETLTRSNRWQEAWRTLQEAVDAGADDEDLLDMYRRVRYAAELNWKTYSDMRPLSGGSYAVCTAQRWSYLSPEGSSETGGAWSFASPVGEDGIRVVAEEEQAQILDGDGTLRGKLSFVPEDAGAFSGGLIPILRDGRWGFYDSLGDYQFGSYLYASRYQNGVAAVAEAEDVWYFIGADGERVSDRTYQQVGLSPDGSWIVDGVYLLKNDDVFQIYSQKDGVVDGFSCDDVDVLTGDGLLAFSRGGQWGYVSLQGEVVIEPVYAAAKSFSNGLAAVSDGETWGFIDSTGETVIDAQYLDADYFNSAGGCMVKTTEVTWQVLMRKVRETSAE